MKRLLVFLLSALENIFIVFKFTCIIIEEYQILALFIALCWTDFGHSFVGQRQTSRQMITRYTDDASEGGKLLKNVLLK